MITVILWLYNKLLYALPHHLIPHHGYILETYIDRDGSMEERLVCHRCRKVIDTKHYKKGERGFYDPKS